MSLQIIDENGEIRPAPRNLPQDVFLDFERQDNDQIVKELRGEVIQEYAYQFQQGGSTVTGLSLMGVMAVAQKMGGISCAAPVWQNTDDEYVCDISATDHKTGTTVWATASEPRVMHTKNGDKPDRFARAKALSKAQRNAIYKLIPAPIALDALKEALMATSKRPARNAAVEVKERPSRPAALDDGDDLMTDDQINALYGHGRTLGFTMPQKLDDEIARRGWGALTREQGRDLYRWLTDEDRRLVDEAARQGA